MRKCPRDRQIAFRQVNRNGKAFSERGEWVLIWARPDAHIRTPRLREEPTEEDLSGKKKQKVGGKIDIADRVSWRPVSGRYLGLTSLQPPTDFFGRPIAVKPASKPASKAGLAKTTSPVPVISYKFNEGNSAAVRKAVKVSSFL